MCDLFLLSDAQIRRIARHFPLSHSILPVDDRLIVSGTFYVIKNRPAVARCTPDLRTAKDDLRPLYPLEKTRRIQPHFAQLAGQAR